MPNGFKHICSSQILINGNLFNYLDEILCQCGYVNAFDFFARTKAKAYSDYIIYEAPCVIVRINRSSISVSYNEFVPDEEES